MPDWEMLRLVCAENQGSETGFMYETPLEARKMAVMSALETWRAVMGVQPPVLEKDLKY
jgi:hypothetical protein